MTIRRKKPTPQRIYNRSGLSALEARIGTHSRFYESMVRGLADANRPGLSELRTRAKGDYTLGMLDAWASVCDTLTFYAERTADEAYLRTATERESIRAHARLIGYELAPAKAAATFLAFTAEEVNSPDETLNYDAGLQIRSVPRDGQVPQIFETIEPLVARANWNELRPRQTYPQILEKVTEGTVDTNEITLTADAPNISVGDPILFLDGSNPIPFSGDIKGFLRRVTKVNDGENGQHIVQLATVSLKPKPYMLVAYIIPTYYYYGSLSSNDGDQVEDTESLGDQLLNYQWPVSSFYHVASDAQVTLAEFNNAIAAVPVDEKSLIEPYLMRVIAGFLGNTAIVKRIAPLIQGSGNTASISAKSYSLLLEPGSILDTQTHINDMSNLADKFIYLEREFLEIVTGSYILIRDPSQEAWVKVKAVDTVSVEVYGASNKVTRLTVNTKGINAAGVEIELSIFMTRTANVYAVPEQLPLAELKILDAVGDENEGNKIEIDRAEIMLSPDTKIAITGERVDFLGVVSSEIRTIVSNDVIGGRSVLTLNQPLSHAYQRETVVINANIAEATHGETTHEILGDGDATISFQTFQLKSKPLTYLSAPTSTGMVPSLEVRVDRIRWELKDDFREAGSEDRVFIIRINEDGKVRLIFGDGIQGQRPSTGQDNIEVSYRRGAGFEGHLEAGQLTLLSTKPSGLKGVTNPLPPSGASDSEGLENARLNAPLKIMTLGRVVSLQDYEDFSRSFASIAKAKADWTFDGFSRPIFITVAGQEGVLLPQNGKDIMNLRSALKAAGEADIQVTVRNYRRIQFIVKASVWIKPDYIADDVLINANNFLEQAFSFEMRVLGQSVSQAQVIAVLQSVDGVLGVDLDFFHRTGAEPSLEKRLSSAIAQPNLKGAIPTPAELLTIDMASSDLEAVI